MVFPSEMPCYEMQCVCGWLYHHNVFSSHSSLRVKAWWFSVLVISQQIIVKASLVSRYCIFPRIYRMMKFGISNIVTFISLQYTNGSTNVSLSICTRCFPSLSLACLTKLHDRIISLPSLCGINRILTWNSLIVEIQIYVFPRITQGHPHDLPPCWLSFLHSVSQEVNIPTALIIFINLTSK